jgi:hypothetical protein
MNGSTIQETINGILHDTPRTLRKLAPNVPRDLEAVCLKCLEKEPSRRYASAGKLADDLHRWLDGKPTLARPVGVAGRVVKWMRRRPTVTGLLAACILALGKRCLSVGTDQRVRLWDADAGVELAEGTAHSDRVLESRSIPPAGMFSLPGSMGQSDPGNFLRRTAARAEFGTDPGKVPGESLHESFLARL